jgi:energy-coupling factor transporter ATP-binding protein EcfA2
MLYDLRWPVRRIYNLIQKIMIMHNYNGFEDFFDRIIHMENGKIKKEINKGGNDEYN